MIGGYGGGKTFPSEYAAFKHCFENPGHQFVVFRNTETELKATVEADMVSYALENGLAKPSDWRKSDHDLFLINGLQIMFRPLAMHRDNFKGYHLCGFFMDDPDVDRYEDLLSFFFSRLRDKHVRASSFKTFWAANWEGRNWLWKIFMRNKAEGECDMRPMNYEKPSEGEIDPFAYWLCPTDKNKTLSESYIPDLAKIHSQAWMDRFVYMKNLDAHSALIYPDFNPQTHHRDLSGLAQRTDLIKILVMDNGFGTTCVLKMATDGKAIYVYDEWVKHGAKMSEIGGYVVECRSKEAFNRMIIDPSSARGEQASDGVSVKKMLWRDYGLNFIGANNDVDPGLHFVRDLIKPAVGEPMLYMDFGRCRITAAEMQEYRFKEPSSADFDDVSFEEKPVKKRDHGPDNVRYGAIDLKRHLSRREHDEARLHAERAEAWERKFKEMPLYRSNPRLVADMRSRINLRQNIDIASSTPYTMP